MTGAQVRFAVFPRLVVVSDPRRDLLAVVEQAAAARRRIDDLVRQAQESQRRMQATYAALAASAMRGIPLTLPARRSKPGSRPAQSTAGLRTCDLLDETGF
ncbi:MAG: hypothetical protein F4Y03_11830 [Alphaproteobacteria bacterium]|nr:hypothetical protein [Alphaproteobacteria bacterium]